METLQRTSIYRQGIPGALRGSRACWEVARFPAGVDGRGCKPLPKKGLVLPQTMVGWPWCDVRRVGGSSLWVPAPDFTAEFWQIQGTISGLDLGEWIAPKTKDFLAPIDLSKEMAINHRWLLSSGFAWFLRGNVIALQLNAVAWLVVRDSAGQQLVVYQIAWWLSPRPSWRPSSWKKLQHAAGMFLVEAARLP